MEAPASACANGATLGKCRDHLLGNSGSGSVSEKRDESPLLLNSLQKAARPRSTGPGAAPAATAGRAVACNQGYKWCWTAANYDNGPWARCNRGWDREFDDLRFSCSGGCAC
ncbi:hypothetical protein MY3296_004307 [Beauveria thailandica]